MKQPPIHASSHGTPPLATPPTAYFPALTGVRAAAAFMVVLFHLNPLLYANQDSTTLRWANYFIQQLHVGVPIFFVLSGFLITHRYFKIVTLSTAWLKNFFWNRFIRIYPLYFILTSITFLIAQYASYGHSGLWHSPGFSWKDKLFAIALNLTLLKAFFQTTLTSGIPAAWSLTVEETFYALSPLLLIGLRRNVKYLLLYPAIALLIGSLLVYTSTLSPHYLYGFMKSMNFMLRFTFFGRCAEFMYGAALAIYVAAYRPPTTTINSITGIGVLGIVTCIILLAAIKVHHIPTALWPTAAPSVFVQNLILPFFAALLLHGLIEEKTLLRSFLETETLILLGKSSYALYLLHTGPLDDLFSYFISDNKIIKLVCYPLAAMGLFLFVEEPIRIKLRKVLSIYSQ